MHSKERVRKAIIYEKTDRIPAGLFGTHYDYKIGLAEYMGCCCIEDMYRKLGIDIWHTEGLRYIGGPKKYRGRDVDPTAELYFENNPNPPFCDIRSLEEVEQYPFPSMEEFDESELLNDIVAHEDFALCNGINAALFHNYLYMCGQENALCYLKTDPDIALAIIRKITDYWADYLDRVLTIADNRGVMVENCNDFGTQLSTFISAQDFKTFFKPSLMRLCDIAHRHGVFYMQHSCGAVGTIIDDFIDMGADILNPIQVCAVGMKLEGVVQRFLGRIAFYGGIDTQYLLPQGSKDKIRKTVQNAVSLFKGEGGYILSGSQGFLNDIPYAHAVSMLDPELRCL